jgi:Fic family protein
LLGNSLGQTGFEMAGWLDFFLDGVATISDEAAGSARDLFNIVAADRTKILGAESASVSALRLFEQLPRHPIVTVATAMKLLETSKPTATRAIETLADIGILAETTGKKRGRSFAYRAYMERLRTGTELDVRG